MRRSLLAIAVIVVILVLAIALPGYVADRNGTPQSVPSVEGAWTDEQAIGELRATVWDSPLLKLQMLASAVVMRQPCPSPVEIDGRLLTEERTMTAYGPFGLEVAQGVLPCDGVAKR